MATDLEVMAKVQHILKEVFDIVAGYPEISDCVEDLRNLSLTAENKRVKEQVLCLADVVEQIQVTLEGLDDCLDRLKGIAECLIPD